MTDPTPPASHQAWAPTRPPARPHVTAPASTAARARNPLGLVSLLLGIANVVASIVASVAYAFAPGFTAVPGGGVAIGYDDYFGTLDAISTATTFAFGLSGLALGVIALVLPRRPRALAAAGTALAASVLVGMLATSGVFAIADLLQG